MFESLKTEKIGNLLIYLAENIKDLNKTKLLKLLYIIDETAILRYGVPVTWLEHKAWKWGPVAEFVYDAIEKKDVPTFQKYIKIEKNKTETLIMPNAFFSDDEFSNAELALIDEIIKKYGNYTANQLIDLLHQQNTLWHKEVSNHRLDFLFKLQSNKSNHVLELATLLDRDVEKQFIYQTAFEALSFQESLQ